MEQALWVTAAVVIAAYIAWKIRQAPRRSPAEPGTPCRRIDPAAEAES
jgi:hypothetical protein